MISPLMGQQGRQDPFALEPGDAAAKALWTGVAEFQAPWPFTPLVLGELEELEEFIDRWAGWFAAAAQSYGPTRRDQDSPLRARIGGWMWPSCVRPARLHPEPSGPLEALEEIVRISVEAHQYRNRSQSACLPADEAADGAHQLLHLLVRVGRRLALACSGRRGRRGARARSCRGPPGRPRSG
jgi:hypothetical protein